MLRLDGATHSQQVKVVITTITFAENWQIKNDASYKRQ